MNKYKIIWSSEFLNELDDVLYYLTFKLKEINGAKKFYKKVLNSLAPLEYFPNGYSKIYCNNTSYRKLFVDNYIIIYLVSKNTRTSSYLTYFPQYTKLFTSIIILSFYFKQFLVIKM